MNTTHSEATHNSNKLWKKLTFQNKQSYSCGAEKRKICQRLNLKDEEMLEHDFLPETSRKEDAPEILQYVHVVLLPGKGKIEGRAQVS